jgi:hypothetical protein
LTDESYQPDPTKLSSRAAYADLNAAAAELPAVERARFITAWNGVETGLDLPLTNFVGWQDATIDKLIERYPLETLPKAIADLHRGGTGAGSFVGDNPLNFRSLAQVGEHRRPLEWRVREVLLADGFLVVGGAEKTLKSIILILLAIAVAGGTPLFCDERFTVKERRRVLVLTGEGSVELFYDRVEHLCKLCGVNFEELKSGGWIEVTDRIEKTSSGVFRSGLGTRIEAFDPGLVILDPAYVYVDPAGRAGDVFTMGALLAELRDLCGGRACAVGHHFTKAGEDALTLSSLTQAGAREVFDHWLLVKHAEAPDLERQRFRLHARLGARRGFGWEATFEVTLGPLDLDTLQHVGDPGWRVLRGAEANAEREGDDADWRYWRRSVYQDVRDAPWELTQNDLVGKGDHAGRRRKALDWLRHSDHPVVRTQRIRGPKGERVADRYGPLFTVEKPDEFDFDAWAATQAPGTR